MANPILSNGLASPQSIYDELGVSATNQSRAEGYHPVGTRAFLPDGRVFYYASNGGTALTVGSLCIGSALSRSGNHDKITLTDSSANFAAGARTGIVLQESDVDTSDIITNEYKDGFLGFEQPDGAGAGHIYKIANHSQFDASGTATSGTIDLFDPIKVSADTSDEITLCRNPWDRVITSTTAEEELAVGVSPIAITASTALATDVTTAVAATTTYFFWAQTWGPAMVEVDDTTVALGVGVMSANTADRVEQHALATGAHTSNATTLAVTGSDREMIGVGLVPAVDEAGDFGMVFLKISP